MYLQIYSNLIRCDLVLDVVNYILVNIVKIYNLNIVKDFFYKKNNEFIVGRPLGGLDIKLIYI